MTDAAMPAPRELLYGDVPLETFAAAGGEAPWTTLRDAARAIAAGEPSRAIPLLRSVAADQGLEARLRLEAWSGLRSLGIAPTAQESSILEGVVIDVIMPVGRDTLAVYADTSAVYINHSEAAQYVTPGAAYGAEIEAVLAAGRVLLPKIGLWHGPRPPLPGSGAVRISLLTAGGLSFGQGDMAALSADRLGGPVIAASLALLQKMVLRQTGAASEPRASTNPISRFFARFKR
jgi:hypothetical protein